MVRTDGTIQWRGSHLYVSEALVGEPLGLEEIETNAWLMHFGQVRLGLLNHTRRDLTIVPAPIQ